jgi:hypothetical protein
VGSGAHGDLSAVMFSLGCYGICHIRGRKEWKCSVTCRTWEKQQTYRNILRGDTLIELPLKRLERRWENNIKVDLKDRFE